MRLMIWMLLMAVILPVAGCFGLMMDMACFEETQCQEVNRVMGPSIAWTMITWAFWLVVAVGAVVMVASLMSKKK